MTTPNEAILASAGSGKTYQLTNRYIALMAMQMREGGAAAPERIIALTFTRKAAGEFFDSILLKLAEAASDPEEAGKLSADPDAPLSGALAGLEPGDFRRLLRTFISRMPRLFLGTLDSFYGNILRSFPAEFGIASGFEVLDDYRAALAKEQVYDLVFTRNASGRRRADQEQKSFLEAFQRATIGKEQSGILRILDDFVDKLHKIYLDVPDPEKWGSPSAIWPGETSIPWLDESIDPNAELDRIERSFASREETKYSEKWWGEFRAEAAEYRPGQGFGYRMGTVIAKLVAQREELENGDALITLDRKKHEFDPVASEAALRLVHHFVGGEIRARLDRTRGIHRLLRDYEECYSGTVRRQGALTFQDIQLLLAGTGMDADAGEGPEGKGRPAQALLTQSPGGDERLRIDYRLDGRYDHWLLDEFQDTSFLQWKILRNLVDEVVQDTSGERSFFQVGDVKQAIYGWRGGDTRLFTDILRNYNSGGKDRIRIRSLDVSWRSGPDVIGPVNRVFRDHAAMENLGLPGAAVERWAGVWSEHRPSPPMEKKTGATLLLNPLPGEENQKAGKEDKFALVAGILREIEPVKRGIRCAVLVQGNKTGNQIVEYLRAHTDCPVASESDQSIAEDNPVNLALLSLFQNAAHPGDRHAWEHLRLTPYRAVIDREEFTPGRLARRTASAVFEMGFETASRKFLEQLGEELETGPDGALDPFSRGRAEAFLLAARQFDESGDRDIDRFLAYARKSTASDTAASGAVQVLTIHKAKGLTYDMAILPELEGGSMTKVNEDIAAPTNADREVQWVFAMPPKDVSAADPVLATHNAQGEADAAYESLCKFYVAMTRARYANYLVAEPLPKKATAKSFGRLLTNVLDESAPDGDEAEDGGEVSGRSDETEFGGQRARCLYRSDTPRTDPRWYEKFSMESEKGIAAVQATAPEPDDAPPPVPAVLARPRPGRRTPSGSEKATVTAAQIFSREGRAARAFGNLVHRFFEDIEWHDAETFPALAEKWKAEASPGLSPGSLGDAIEQVRRSLEDPGIAQALSRPSADAVCWRERSFEIHLDGEWLSGVFDRVVIEPDRASIFDFKTDRVAGDKESLDRAVEKYRPQLETYRQVLARMTGLPGGKIDTGLIFTRVPRLVRVS